MILDPSQVALDPVTGEDRPEALEHLTPEVCFAESQGWPKSYFYSPWPLSEDFFLVAFSHEPLPGGYTGEHRDTETGIYFRAPARKPLYFQAVDETGRAVQSMRTIVYSSQAARAPEKGNAQIRHAAHTLFNVILIMQLRSGNNTFEFA
jgi:hypothetical protein